MIIKLVSYPDWNDSLSLADRKLRIRTAAEILNAKDSDFVMFSEWIFTSKNDLNKLAESVHNKKVTALFELKLASGLKGNRLFLLQNGEIKDLKTHQILKNRDEATPENISKLIDELESHRTFEVNGKRFLIIQCGENSILKTIKGEKYKSGFCLQDRDLKKKFNAIIDSVDVILNPSHNYWPRIYDFLCRLHTFSEKRRYCFYCTQLNLNGNMLANAHLHPEKNSAQRCYHSRRLIAPIYNSDKEEINYLLQAYEIGGVI